MNLVAIEAQAGDMKLHGIKCNVAGDACAVRYAIGELDGLFDAESPDAINS